MFVFLLMNLHFLKRYKKAQINWAMQKSIQIKPQYPPNYLSALTNAYDHSNVFLQAIYPITHPAVKCALFKFKCAASLNVFQHVILDCIRPITSN